MLVDVIELSALFQKTFLRLLREIWEFEGIPFRGEAIKYEDLQEWRSLYESVQKPWVVYAKRPSTGPKQTLAYLSRYTHSVAISEHRILELGAEKVKIRYKDYADETVDGLPKKKELELSYMDFIKKFVKHILPSGFQKIRYYGIWAASNRKTKLAKCQQLLEHVPLQLTIKAIKAIVKEKLGIDPTVCRYCGSPDLVTEVLTEKPILTNLIYAKNGKTGNNRAPPNLPRHGLAKWIEVRFL